jgi:hypothetical protein
MCRPCQYAPIKRHWDDVIADAEKKLNGVDASGEAELYGRLERELEDLREDRNAEEWRCRKMFPVAKREEVEKKIDTIGDVVTARSPLWREILPEDIKVVEEVRVSWTVFAVQLTLPKVWGNPDNSSWELILTTFEDDFMDKYMWVGPSLDLAALMKGEVVENKEESEGGAQNATGSAMQDVDSGNEARFHVEYAENDEGQQVQCSQSSQGPTQLGSSQNFTRREISIGEDDWDLAERHSSQAPVINSVANYIGFFPDEPTVPRWMSAEDMIIAANGIDMRKKDSEKQSVMLLSSSENLSEKWTRRIWLQV